MNRRGTKVLARQCRNQNVRRTCSPSRRQIDRLQVRRTRAAKVFSFKHALHRLQSREDLTGFTFSYWLRRQPVLGLSFHYQSNAGKEVAGNGGRGTSLIKLAGSFVGCVETDGTSPKRTYLRAVALEPSAALREVLEQGFAELHAGVERHKVRSDRAAGLLISRAQFGDGL